MKKHVSHIATYVVCFLVCYTLAYLGFFLWFAHGVERLFHVAENLIHILIK